MARQNIPSLQTLLQTTGQFGGGGAICPHCGTHAAFETLQEMPFPNMKAMFGIPGLIIEPATIIFSNCTSCKGAAIGVYTNRSHQSHRFLKGALLWPSSVLRPDKSPVGVEPEVKAAYDEARNVLPLSAMGAAVLARRCLQHVIRSKLGIKKKNLFDEIVDACHRQEMTLNTRQALDHVREIGNWGAHPITTGVDQAETIIEVTPEEADYTIDVVELLFHDLYVVPEKTSAMKALILSKKKGTGS